MASIINAATSGGLITTADTSGVLQLQTAGTTAVSISAAQVVNFTNAPTVGGAVFGLTGATSSGSPYLTALGSGAATSTTGVINTAVGFQALNANVTGTAHTAVGYLALNAATGDNNVAVGANALRYCTSGSNNAALGYAALNSNTTASGNTAVGTTALYNNTTGVANTAIGYQAMYSNTGNYQSTAVGYRALYNSNATLSSASYNDAFGCEALYSCTTGVGNVAMGSFGYAGSSSALWSCTTGGYNTAIGQGALRALSTGSSHTAVGNSALWNATTGDSNVCIGQSAGYEITTGSRNVFVGNGTGVGGFGVSGPITTGQYNIMIGMTACGSSPSVSNAIVIAATFSQQDKGSSTGFIAPGGGGVYQGNNSSTWSQTSDGRLKKNIVDNTTGLEKINGIRVRNFEYRLPEEVDPELKPADAIKKPGIQLGVIAQELQEVLPDCVKQETTGVLAVDPDNLTWYTINAIKELSAANAALAARVAQLEAK